MMLAWLGCGYAVLSVITLVVYGRDKWAAKHQRWRTAERTLHLLALLGGWPGAILAQKVFTHKTSKSAFQRLFLLSVLCNLLMLGVIFRLFFDHLV
ncbi:MAG: uncharacterized membrane protein YsdA (DUF1294 family) [Moritella sp.]|jgi:uncharacterized membrane protein YsdA (DUF1294 family)